MSGVIKRAISFTVILLSFAGLQGIPETDAHTYGVTAPGDVFLSNFVLSPIPGVTPFLMALDNTGAPVWSREMPGLMYLDLKLQNDSLMTYFDFSAGKFYGLDHTFAAVDSFSAVGYPTDEHELLVLPDGHALLFGNDIRTMDLTACGGQPDARVVGFVLQNLNPDGTLAFQWRTLDFLPVTEVADSTLLTGANVDYIHCNAITLDEDGNYIISARHLDRIIKIDRNSGGILWQWGGERSRHNDFTFVGDDWNGFTGFSHQHAIRYLGDNRFLMFDNGNLKDIQASRAVEYELNQDSLLARRVWQYAPEPVVYSSAMGCAQRLGNGNTMIGWGQNESALTAREVNPAGQVVWELSLPEGEYSYRVFRLPFDWTSPDLMLRITRISPRVFDLEWDAAPGATGYRIYRQDTPGGDDWRLYRTVQGDVNHLQFEDMSATGFYRVTAVYLD
jgi:hypothetical protein